MDKETLKNLLLSHKTEINAGQVLDEYNQGKVDYIEFLIELLEV